MKAMRADKAAEVHKRTASATSVEPDKLWLGYAVNVLDEFQGKTRVWTKIYYLFNGKPHTGWVTKESLVDFDEPPWEDKFPPDVPKLDFPCPHVPTFEFKFFRNKTEAAITIAIILVAVAIVVWPFM